MFNFYRSTRRSELYYNYYKVFLLESGFLNDSILVMIHIVGQK